MSLRWKIDTHCHTMASPDSLASPAAVIAAARRRGLDRLVITDHNTLEGALAAQALAPDFVIVGEEIATQEGELLALFVRDPVPPGLPAEEAIARLRAQGAFISVSHPFDRWRSGHWRPEALQRILPLVDAIEGFNARSMWPGANRRALAFAQAHGVPITVGSDAHHPLEIGRAHLVLPPFHDASSFRLALQQATWRGRPSGWWVHLLSRYAAYRQRS